MAWVNRPSFGGDTMRLIPGTETLATCLGDGTLVACGFWPELTTDGQMSPIGPYPLLQYLPDLAAYGAGASRTDRAQLLALLSGFAVGVIVAVFWLVLRRIGPFAWRWALLVCVVAGPVLAYGSSTWGEMLASALLALLVAATILPAHPVLVGLATLGAALTKETAYPFVVAVGLTGLLLARQRSGSGVRRHAAWGGAGLAVGLVAASLFNVIRFGSIANTNYLQPEFRTPTVGRAFEFGAGLFVAPNGGILVFWPLATLVMSALLLVPIGRVAARRLLVRDAWVAFALVAVIVGLVAGLATWWAPFGWIAWGPRLSLPWVMPLLLLGTVAYGRLLTPFAARLLQPRWRAVGIAAVTFVVTLPHVGYLWRPEQTLEFFTVSTGSCPATGSITSESYYDCVREEMWTRHPIVLDALSGLRTVGGGLTALAVAAALAGAVALFRDESRRAA